MNMPILKGSYADPSKKKTETNQQANTTNTVPTNTSNALPQGMPILKGSYADPTVQPLPADKETQAAIEGKLPTSVNVSNIELATGPVTSNGKEVAEEAGQGAILQNDTGINAKLKSFYDRSQETGGQSSPGSFNAIDVNALNPQELDTTAKQTILAHNTKGYGNLMQTLSGPYNEDKINEAASNVGRELAQQQVSQSVNQMLNAPKPTLMPSGQARQNLIQSLNTLDEGKINEAAIQYQSSLASENKQAKQAQQEAALNQRVEGYRQLTNAPDYKDKSRYVSTYQAGKTTNKNEIKYNYINGNKEAIDYIDNGPFKDIRYLKNMNATEKGMYNYLYKTQGANAAEQFLTDIQSDLYERNRQKTEKYWTEIAEKYPLEASVFSVAAKPLEAMTTPQQVIDYLRDGRIDQNAPYNTGVHAISAVRSDVAKKIEKILGEKWGPAGSFLYNTGMSMADSVVNMAPAALMGKLGEAKEAVEIAEKIMLGVMGSGAAADTIVAKKDQGLDENRAIALGLIAGFNEYITERIGMDSMMEILTKDVSEKTFKQYVFKSLLQQTGAEGLEEGLSDVLNWSADLLYAAATDSPSEFEDMIRTYMKDGKSSSEALSLAVMDRMSELGLDVLGGALSGFFMGAGGSLINYGGEILSRVNTIEKSKSAQEALVEEGLKSDHNTSAYEAAKRNQKTLNEGDSLGTIQILHQMSANEQAIRGEEAVNQNNRWQNLQELDVASRQEAPTLKPQTATKPRVELLTGIKSNDPQFADKVKHKVDVTEQNISGINADNLSANDKVKLKASRARLQAIAESDLVPAPTRVKANQLIQQIDTTLSFDGTTPVQQAPVSTPVNTPVETAPAETAPKVEGFQGRKQGDVRTVHRNYVPAGSELETIIKTAPIDNYDTVGVYEDGAMKGTIVLTQYDDFNGNANPTVVNTVLGRQQNDGSYRWVKVDNYNGSVLTDKHNLVDTDYQGFNKNEAQQSEKDWKALASQYNVNYDPEAITTKEGFAEFQKRLNDRIASDEMWLDRYASNMQGDHPMENWFRVATDRELYEPYKGNAIGYIKAMNGWYSSGFLGDSYNTKLEQDPFYSFQFKFDENLGRNKTLPLKEKARHAAWEAGKADRNLVLEQAKTDDFPIHITGKESSSDMIHRTLKSKTFYAGNRDNLDTEGTYHDDNYAPLVLADVAAEGDNIIIRIREMPAKSSGREIFLEVPNYRDKTSDEIISYVNETYGENAFGEHFNKGIKDTYVALGLENASRGHKSGQTISRPKSTSDNTTTKTEPKAKGKTVVTPTEQTNTPTEETNTPTEETKPAEAPATDAHAVMEELRKNKTVDYDGQRYRVKVITFGKEGYYSVVADLESGKEVYNNGPFRSEGRAIADLMTALRTKLLDGALPKSPNETDIVDSTVKKTETSAPKTETNSKEDATIESSEEENLTPYQQKVKEKLDGYDKANIDGIEYEIERGENNSSFRGYLRSTNGEIGNIQDAHHKRHYTEWHSTREEVVRDLVDMAKWLGPKEEQNGERAGRDNVLQGSERENAEVQEVSAVRNVGVDQILREWNNNRSEDESLFGSGVLPEAEYREAVNRGDLDTALNIVVNIAKSRGYNTIAFYGNSNANLASAHVASRGKSKGLLYASSNPDVSSTYYPQTQGKVYAVALRLGEHPLVINAGGKTYKDIVYEGQTVSTDQIGHAALNDGNYTSVIIEDVVDMGGYYDSSKDLKSASTPSTDYILFDGTNVALLDPVLRDDSGNLMTLEERFPQVLKTESAAENVKATSPQQQIADEIIKDIREGKSFDSKHLFEIANRAYGGTQAEGVYTVKDAYDGMELAINQYLMSADFIKEANGDATKAVATIQRLQELLNSIPTQTKRSNEEQIFQQFSTPPTIAYLAAWTANINANDVVLEPSAGIGGLALWPKAWGATVYGNELSERRLAFLNELGLDGTFNFNAEHIHNLLPDDIKPSVVIMNPPFSSTAGRTSTNKTENAVKHIESALDRLEPGGRLVAVLGRGMENNSKTFGPWWNKLRKEYSIRANVRIDGSNYKKYGTTFDVQLVIIDKVGAQKGTTIVGEYTDLTEIPSLLEGVRDVRERVDTRDQADAGSIQQRGMEPGRDTGVRTDDTAGSNNGTVKNSGNDRLGVQEGDVHGPGDQNATGRRRDRSSDNESVQGVQKGNRQSESERGEDNRQGGRSDGTRSNSAKSDGNNIKSSEVKLQDSETAAKEVNAVKASNAENIDNVYSQYVPQKARIEGSKKHPAKLVESSAMAAVEPPDVTYTPNIPKELVTSGALSDAQLENVIYAGQAHNMVLPNGQRKGFFIGDGTGVGKGRQIAGIILDNMRQGRTKAVWISEKQKLYNDAKRDWRAMGGNDQEVINFSDVKYKKGKSIADTIIALKEKAEGGKKGKKVENVVYDTPSTVPGQNILYTTYDTLKTDYEGGKDSKGRKQVLLDWLGKDFDGVIVFDEAHNMSNATGKQGTFGKSKASAKALAAIDLQNTFPNARIVYATATGATEVSNYAYLQRLGLWGKGTAFNDFNDFAAKISAGGLAAMELLARDMKTMGDYMARSISYDDVQYDTLEHQLTPTQVEIYNTMSFAWQKVLQNINKALEITGANNNGQVRGRILSQIYSTQQRFYNQILTSMSMPSVLSDIRKELDNGRSVVLQIVNTNEAAQERAIAKNAEEGGDLDDLDLTPSDMLIDLTANVFPIEVYEEYEDENGNLKSRRVLDANGKPLIDKKAVQMRDDLIAELKMMKVPDGPLEMLLNTFGVENVAEVTGRSRRVVEKADGTGGRKRVIERLSEKSKEADINMFQDGKKRILVFSDAGGTGASYHADLNAKNQQQRVHYLVQAGWEATKAVQGFGRTHRSNQRVAPIFRLVTTNVMGQKRFTSTIARRLDQLGALTKGQRQTGSGVFGEKDNLENPIAMDALSRYYRRIDPDIVRKLGLYDKVYDEFGRFNEKSEVIRDVSKFLNRILSLEIDEQNEVFQGFYDTFSIMMDQAIENGTVDMGLENFKADKIEVIDENVIRKDPSGADTKYVQMTVYNKPVLTEYSKALDLHNNFQGIVRLEDGSVRAVYEISSKTNERTGAIQRRFKLEGPVRGITSTYVETTLQDKTTPIPKSEWKQAWNEEAKKAPEYTTNTLHMLTGVLLPVWDRLPTEHTRVMRVMSDDGRQYLGRIIPSDKIDEVLRQIGGSKRTLKVYTGKEIASAILNEGKEARLRDDRIRLVRSRVSGENRIEVKGANLWGISRQYPGVFTEKINYDTRVFIPVGPVGEAIIDDLMKDNPVIDVYKPSSNDDTVASKATSTTQDQPSNYVVLKEETIDKYLKDYATKFTPNYAQAFITYMSPDDFLKLTTSGQASRMRIESQTGELDLDELKDATIHQPFYLRMDTKTGRIEGHEGRHRATALSRAGVTQIPVLIFDSRNDKEHIASIVLKGQNFNGKYNRARVTAENLIPFNYANRDEIIERFTQRPAEQSEESTISYAKNTVSNSRWDAERVGDTDVTVKPLSDIVADIQNWFDVNITNGHISMRDALGTYDKRYQGIRTKDANDLPTLLHELGHKLDDEYDLVGGMSDAIKEELVNNLDPEFKTQYSKKALPGEGIAEYLRYYMQNSAFASKKYPRFTKYLMEKMSYEAYAQLQTLADEANAYYALGGETATDTVRLKEEGVPDDRTWKKKIKDTFNNIKQDVITDNWGIHLFDEATGSNVEMIADNSAYTDAIIGQTITGAQLWINGEYKGPGLKTCLEGVNLEDKEEYRLFGELYKVVHGIERYKEGLQTFADPRKDNTEWMEKRRDEILAEHPDWMKNIDMLTEFTRTIRDAWLVDTGLLDKQTVDDWDKRYEHYVPFYRVLTKHGKGGGPNVADGYVNQTAPVYKAVGSGLDTWHPVDNIIDFTIKAIKAGSLNRVGVALVEAAQETNANAKLLETIPTPMTVTAVSTERLKKAAQNQLETEIENGNVISNLDVDVMQGIIENMDDVIYRYSPANPHGDIICVMVNGNRRYYKVNDPLLLKSLLRLNHKKAEGILGFYGKFSRFMTSNITGNNLVWSIFSNAPRDFMTLLTYAHTRNVATLVQGITSAYKNMAKGDNADPLFMEYLSMGGGNQSVYSVEQDVVKNARRKLFGKNASLNPLDYIGFVADVIEMGPRFAEYSYCRSIGMTPEEAIWAAHDVTVNFARGGKISREINKVIPFFNASIQGADKMFRYFTAEDIKGDYAERRNVATTRFLGWVAASAILAMLTMLANYRDDDTEKEYEQLSNYTKNAYFNIPLGDGMYFAIPKPRELGVLTSFFESVVEYFYGKNRHAFDEFYSYVVDNALPGGASDLAQGDWKGALGSFGVFGLGAYMMANRDFLGKPIVSSSLEKLEPELQYDRRTSKAALLIGQTLKTSPKMVDYFLQNTLGGFWKYQKALFPVGEEYTDWTLGVKNSYFKDNQYSTDLVNWLYDQAAASDTKARSYKSIDNSITAKMDSNMTTFYGRYYNLAKNKTESDRLRATRQTVLDMIYEYRKASDNETMTAAQKAVYKACKAANDTAGLPAVMNTEVEDSNGKKHQLNDYEYVKYQTYYLDAYYSMVNSTFKSVASNADKAKLLKHIKEVAKASADDYILKNKKASSGYFDKFAGLNDSQVAQWKYLMDLTNDDDNSTTQNEVIEAIRSMNLSGEQSYTLFHSKYKSDKNNPWRAYAH